MLNSIVHEWIQHLISKFDQNGPLPWHQIPSAPSSITGAGTIVVPRLRECCRQVEAEEVSNSRNIIHQTWGRDHKFAGPCTSKPCSSLFMLCMLMPSKLFLIIYTKGSGNSVREIITGDFTHTYTKQELDASLVGVKWHHRICWSRGMRGQQRSGFETGNGTVNRACLFASLQEVRRG